MITVNTIDIFPSDNYVDIALSTGKKYKILLKDYENLPFDCQPDCLLENIIIDVTKLDLSETNQYFDGDCVAFLFFLSRKHTIYRSAISKVSMTDIPKKLLISKLYYSYKNIKNKNKAIIEIDPEILKNLCGLVCDEFEERGYIDDRRYAFDKAKYLKEYKKYGNNKIKEYLYQKRIPADIISEILEDEYFNDESDEIFEDMRFLLIKKYGENLNRLDKSDRNDIQKAINTLIRNGYKYQQAKNTVFDLIEDENIDFRYAGYTEEKEENEDE